MTTSTVPDPQLSTRALLLGKIESIYNTDSLPTAAADAFLVEAPDVKINPNVLTRNFASQSIGEKPYAIGRKLVELSFKHEIKSSGTVGTAAKLCTLLRGCGYAQTTIANTAAAVIATPVAWSGNTSPVVTFGKVTAPTSRFTRYKAAVVLGGASATAKVRLSGTPGEGDSTQILDEEFSAIVYGITPTETVTVVSTNPLVPTYLIAGSVTTGDTVVLSVGGVRFAYVTVGGDTAISIATALSALIAADARFVGTASSGTATVTVACTSGAAGTVVTTASTNLTFNTGAGQFTMTWSGSLVLGDYWIIDTYRPGVHMTPISGSFESLTLKVFYDGQLHSVTGCRGTATIECKAGNYGTMSFTFQGQYRDPGDAAIPTTAVFENTVPVQIETAYLKIGRFLNAVAESWTIDLGNTVTPRESVNSTDGYVGVQITNRVIKGGCNPEAVKESVFPFWKNMATATLHQFNAQVGSTTGNIVIFQSNTVQISDNKYGDRNGNRIYDMSMGFATDSANGDDELRIIFA